MGLFADGTAAAPSISFLLDTNTGIYRSGTDSIALVVGGSANLVVDASATTVYNSTLNVAGLIRFGTGTSVLNSASDGVVKLSNSAQTDFSRLQFGGTTSSFPALRRTGGGLDVVGADNSASSLFRAYRVADFNDSGGLDQGNVRLSNARGVYWSSTASWLGALDVDISRTAAGVITVGNGLGTGTGAIESNGAQIREGRLSTTTGIDLSSTLKQTLYTVPAGKVCYPTRFVFRDASAAITLATITIGFDAGATDVVGATALTGLSSATKYQVVSPMTNPEEGAAAAVLGLDTTVQEGAADTVTVDVYGFLV